MAKKNGMTLDVQNAPQTQEDYQEKQSTEEKLSHSSETEIPIDTPEALEDLITRVKIAQAEYAKFSQAKVDEIFRRAAIAANAERIPLAKAAVEETKMGILEDKVIKNHFASEYIFNQYKDLKTCGVIETDLAFGIQRIAEPVGIICAIIPTTNPTSTAIFKTLIALKTRNAVVISPHPRAKACTARAAQIVRDAAIAAGAPKDLIAWIDEPSIELSNMLMTHRDIALILATGGPGMVKAAYSSGKPAIGVGAGNTPALIDETAEIRQAVNSILLSKTFDNGVICASEQSVIVHQDIYTQVKTEFTARGAYLLSTEEATALGAVILKDGKSGKTINPMIVGQPAHKIAELAGITVPETTKILIGEAERIDSDEPFAYEKLSPVLALYRCESFEDGLGKAHELVRFGGFGHTSVLYTNQMNSERISRFGEVMKTGRILINMPSSQGAIGDLYNFKLAPSLTLGCGSWGGNAVSENVGVKHLLNIKTVAERRENMLWFKVPPKIYHKYGCLPVALGDLRGKKRVFIVTDNYLFSNGYVNTVTEVLDDLGIDFQVFHQVKPDPTLATINTGLESLRAFNPDVIMGFGGGSPMDAAKIMWLLYEHPEVSFEDLALRFMDIEKRIYQFPDMGRKAIMVAIPTTSGTGSEVTPFSVVTDEKTGLKYPIADYALTPTMAIIDSSLVMEMPKGLTAASGIDAVTHAIEAVVSVMSTDYTNGIALESLRVLFKYLPASYTAGKADKKAREKVHNAAAMAGMAFANAFLGVCHSMAHKLGAAFGIPHGVANALIINQTIRFNSTENPTKQAAFPQYEYPSARSRYARIAGYLGLAPMTAMDDPGLQDAAVSALIHEIDALKIKLNLPHSIQAYGIEEGEFLSRVDELSEQAFDDQCTGANPRYPLIKEIKAMYLNAFYGRDEAV